MGSMRRNPVLQCAIVIILVLLSCSAFAGDSHTRGFWHRIAWGETLSSIALAYGVDLGYLARINSICDVNRIEAGSVIWIPGYKLVKARTYSVQKGDCLLDIASKYGVSPWSIASLNGIFDLNLIYPGQRIYIPMEDKK